jgi:hypothetical protein
MSLYLRVLSELLQAAFSDGALTTRYHFLRIFLTLALYFDNGDVFNRVNVFAKSIICSFDQN